MGFFSTTDSNSFQISKTSITGSVYSEETLMDHSSEITDLKLLKDHRKELIRMTRLRNPKITEQELRLSELGNQEGSFKVFCQNTLKSTLACIVIGLLTVSTGFLFIPVFYGIYQLRRLTKKIQLKKVKYDIKKLARQQFPDLNNPITHQNLLEKKIGFNQIDARIKSLEKVNKWLPGIVRAHNEQIARYATNDTSDSLNSASSQEMTKLNSLALSRRSISDITHSTNRSSV